MFNLFVKPVLKVFDPDGHLHWCNTAFTFATWLPNWEDSLKIAAFLFVTVPLGIIQWWDLVKKWKQRKTASAAT